MAEPTYEELKARIAQLEGLAAKNKQPKAVEFKVTLDEGYVQIRNLTPASINLPAFAIRGILERAQQLIPFMTANSHLLSDPSDDEAAAQKKRLAREQNLTTDNPVVRKPRADKQTA